MKALITATIVTLVVLLSVCCNRTPAQQSVKTEPPVAVKAEVADISLTNTRGNNVVDNLNSINNL